MKSKTTQSGSVIHVFEPGERHRVPVRLIGGFADVPGTPPSSGRIAVEIEQPVICIDLCLGDLDTGAVAFEDTALIDLGYAPPRAVSKMAAEIDRWRAKAEKLAEDVARLRTKNAKR